MPKTVARWIVNGVDYVILVFKYTLGRGGGQCPLVKNLHISHNPSPKTKKYGAGTIIASRTDDHDYGQDRYKRHDSYIRVTYA